MPARVADDFLYDGIPLIAIRWWGSYYDTTYDDKSYYPYPNSDNWGDPANNPPPEIVYAFNLNFYIDVPVRQGIPPWSHPGAQEEVFKLPLDGVQVTETFYGTIQ